MIGRSASDNDFRQRPNSPAMKQSNNRRVVNPNFLFFCQIVLLIIPIAVLYVGLYFMNVSSPIIVAVCGVIIFTFLVVFICIRPFTTPEEKGEDSVPLTSDMSPGRKYPYGKGTKAERDAEINRVPTNRQEPTMACPQPSGVPRGQETVQQAMFEACSCPHNPEPHVMNQINGGEQSDDCITKHTESSEEPLRYPRTEVVCPMENESQHAHATLEITASSSPCSEQMEKRESLEDFHSSDDNREHLNMPSLDLLNLKENVPRTACSRNYTEMYSSADSSTDVPIEMVTFRSLKPCANNGLEKQSSARNFDQDHATRAKRMFRDSGVDLVPLYSSKPCADSKPKKQRPKHVVYRDRTAGEKPMSVRDSDEELVARYSEKPCAEIRLEKQRPVREIARDRAARANRVLSRNSSVKQMARFSENPCADQTALQADSKPKKQRLESGIDRGHTTRVKQMLFLETDEELGTPYSPKPCANSKPAKQRPELEVDRDRTARAKRVLFRDSDEEPLPKQIRDDINEISICPYDTTAVGSIPTTLVFEASRTRTALSDQQSVLNDTKCLDKNESSDRPITIRLFPKSSKEGVFQWVKSVHSPEGITREMVSIDGLSSVVYNSKIMGVPDKFTVSVDESCQTILPLKTNTYNHMIVPPLKENINRFEDSGTQVDIPGTTPNPSSVLFIVDEKKQSRNNTSSKIQKSETTRRESSLEESTKSVKQTDDMKEIKADNNLQTGKRDAAPISYESILDFVMRKPLSGKSGSPGSNKKHGSFKTSGESFSDVHFNMIGNEQHKDVVNNNGIDKSSTSSTYHSGLELSMNCETPYLKSKDEKRKDDDEAKTYRTKEFSKKDDQSDDRSTEFYSALRKGTEENTKYQPSRLGLLVTESSKEEILPWKKNTAISPRTKRKSKVRQDDHRWIGRLDYKSTCRKYSPQLDNKPEERKAPNALTSSKRGGRSPSRCQPSSAINDQSPIRNHQIANRYHQSPTKKPIPTSRKEQCPIRKQESPRRALTIFQLPKEGKNFDEEKKQRAVVTHSEGQRPSFPPFNLDFSSSINDDDGFKSPKSRKCGQKEAPQDPIRCPGATKKSQDDRSLLAIQGKVMSPGGSPTKNKSRRISHKVQSTLFKKSSSSYDNVIIERVIKQKKKTLKKFK